MKDHWWSIALATIGVAIVVSAGGHLLTNRATAQWLHYLIDVVLIGGAGVGYLYGALWYRDRPLDTDRYPVVATWIVGSGLVFVSLGVISVYVGSVAVWPFEFHEVVHVTGSVGLFAGLIIGTMHSRSIQRAETAARAEARAAALAAERDRLETLNELLRHYILNSVTIITGYANHLREDAPSESDPALDIIEDRAQLISTLIEHISSIYDQGGPLEPRELQPLVESAIADMSDRPDVAIRTSDCPQTIMADDGFEDALRLLCEAVVTTTEDDGSLSITCTDDAEDTVTLSVTAEPASIPDRLRESLFEPISSGVGMELYIVDQFLKGFGEIRLRDTPGRTLQFDVALTSTD